MQPVYARRPAACRPAARYHEFMRTSPRYGVEICDHCHECPWRNDSFFCQHDRITLKAFDDITFVNAYPEGSLLFGEAEEPRGLFILCSGSSRPAISSGGGKKL